MKIFTSNLTILRQSVLFCKCIFQYKVVLNPYNKIIKCLANGQTNYAFPAAAAGSTGLVRTKQYCNKKSVQKRTI